MWRLGAAALLSGLLIAGCSAPYVPAGPDTSGAHPSGYALPKGAVHQVPDGERGPLRARVGDLVRVGYWGTSWSDGQPRTPVLRLAALDGTEATYQVVAAGTELLITGPVGHPCRESGRSDCGADATPPPVADVTATV